MCWYTDSLDNSFVIDYVPGYGDSLFVASGGSGHGFKFLPVLGKVRNDISVPHPLRSLTWLVQHVVNALERHPDQFTPHWRWRTSAPGTHANGLEEGEMSGRNLSTLEMAEEGDWIWAVDGALKVGLSTGEDITQLEGVREVAAGVERVAITA